MTVTAVADDIHFATTLRDVGRQMQNYLASSAFPIMAIIGIIFVACVLLFRRGIVGELIARLDRRAEK
jgi:hypothetical protein